MRYKIVSQGSYAALNLYLDRGESIRAESGAMVSKDADVNIETHMRGGLWSSIKRSLLGGESFFINTFSSDRDGAHLVLAPVYPGDIRVRELKGETVFLQSGSYLASTGDIEIDTKWKGFKGFFIGEGFFMLKISGYGTLFYNCFGSMIDVSLEEGKEYIVDTGHIVMFDGSLDYSLSTVGGLKSTFLSGEGLVAKFRGKGTIVLQTRSPQQFIGWLASVLPTKEK